MTAVTASTGALEGASRLVVDAELRPVIGSTFQPTNFPNLGAAEFQRPGDGGTIVLVDSVQSLANQLEAVAWDDGEMRPVAPLAGLPYVEIRSADGARVLTSSRLAAHRLADAYVRDAVTADGLRGRDWLVERLRLVKGEPIEWRSLYRAVFELDPLSLVHGVFFSDKEFHGTPRVRRALSVVVEAHDARAAVSGGVKRDDVATSLDVEAGQSAKEGYGFVPFGRTEYTAASIRLSAAIDLQQIRGYGLVADETQLLIDLAQWELATLLEDDLRRRTACDLEVVSTTVRRPSDYAWPTAAQLAERIRTSPVSFGSPGATALTWSGKKLK